MLGGVWADRLPRHRVMVATDLVRAAMHALLAVADLHRRGRDLAHRRDRGRLRRRRGVLPPRLHRPDAADRARGAAPGRQRGDLARRTPWPSSPARRWRPRSCSASAPAGRSRSTPRRSSSPPPSWSGCGRAARGEARGAGLAARRAARRAGREFRARTWVWATVAIFCFMLIFALRALRRARARPWPRTSTARSGVLRRAGGGAGRGDDRRRADRLPLAAAAPDAGGVRRQPRLAGGDRAVRGAARRARCWSPRSCSPAPGWRCSTSGGRRRWRSGSRRTRSRACRPTTGWARSPCCRSATCSPGPIGEAIGPAEVLIVGGVDRRA